MTDFNSLNPSQREAVKTTEGPLLILAGAGSGKTRVITYRVAYLMEECGVAPWNIMAITFTNKAAREMKERVNRLCGTDQGDQVWVATFHSSCARILRRNITELNLGFSNSFTIYDTDDQKNLIRRLLKKLDMDAKVYKEGDVLSRISKAKEQNTTPEQMSSYGSFRDQQIARIYRAYQDEMVSNDALDFDDLLMYTVQLFDKCPHVLEYYRNRFHYIMVDEYQDTNLIQFRLVEQLAGGSGNLCVVGDDDQSIYRFRGADIRNILSFEKHFPGAKVIRLEQNYRSTGHILNAANQVIENNAGRKGKTLFTVQGDGEKVHVRIFQSGNEEARAIIQTISQMAEKGDAYSDFAILYRTNAQSRLLEEACRSFSVPYRIYGGVNFYQRKEIKDILAYLKLVAGGNDDVAVARIVNVPKRGIGDTTVEKIRMFADASGSLSLFEAMNIADQVPGLSKAAASKVMTFCREMEQVRSRYLYGSMDEKKLPHLVQDLLSTVRYHEDLEATFDQNEAETRKENIDEFLSTAMEFEEKWESGEAFASFDREEGDVIEDTPQFKLLKFLEEVALIADIDRMEEDSDYVSMMTMHGAKGLEFPYVFLCGMEEGLFPSQMALRESEDSIEEERRLCYVGITRAEKLLFMTAAKMRALRGEVTVNLLSRFLEELPEKDVDWRDENGSSVMSRRSSSFWEDEDEEEESFGGSSFGGGLPFGGAYQGGSRGKFGSGRGFATASEYREDRSFGGRSFGSSSYGGGSSFGGSSFGSSRFGSRSDSSGGSSGSGSSSKSGSRSYEKTPYRSTGTGGSGSAGGASSRSKNGLPMAKGSSFVKADALDYGPGDRVSHKKFGLGTVKEVKDGGRDYEVTVDFDSAGTKVLMAAFAKLQKV